MLDPKHFTVLAGQDVVDAIRVERDRKPMLDLVKHQQDLAARGYRGAELVQTKQHPNPRSHH